MGGQSIVGPLLRDYDIIYYIGMIDKGIFHPYTLKRKIIAAVNPLGMGGGEGKASFS